MSINNNEHEKKYELLQQYLQDSSWEQVEKLVNTDSTLNLNSELPNGKKSISIVIEKFFANEKRDVDDLERKILFLHENGATLDQVTVNNEPVWFLSALQTKKPSLISAFLKASEPSNRPWNAYQAFLYACQEEVPTQSLREIIRDPFINVEETNEAGENALFFASSQKDSLAAERVFMLLHTGIDVNSVNKNAETPLFSAMEEGASKSIKLLLTVGANPNALDMDGNTPLFKVKTKSSMSEEEKEDLKKKVSYLLESGASLDITNKSGQKLRDKAEFKDWIGWMEEIVAKNEVSALVREIPKVHEKVRHSVKMKI